MAEEWKDDYLRFKHDVISTLGERPNGKTLDRKDNDGNYTLDNLRWATWIEQHANKRITEAFIIAARKNAANARSMKKCSTFA